MVTLDGLRREQRKILRLAGLHGCRNVRVFGSVTARANREDSDVDFLVDPDPGRNLFDLGEFLADLKNLPGVQVDLVKSGRVHPYIRERILAEAIEL
jgi:predicted nucleotidyltransferase